MSTRKNDILPNDIEALKAMLLSERVENKIQITQHKSEITQHKSEITQHKLEIDQHKDKINNLLEIIRLFRHNRFGKSSEKSPDQPELFDEVESEVTEDADEFVEGLESAVENTTEHSTQAEPKPKAGRKPLPAHLDRIVQEHDLPEHLKTCDCGCQKTHISDDVSEQLDIVPAVVRVIQHRRKKYACKKCQANILTADLPKQMIPKSNASAGLLAYLITAKYMDGLPLYRMEIIFERLGMRIPRNTLASWMIKCSEQLQPMFNLLEERMLSSGYLHMDETPVQVLKEPGKNPESKSYMWVRKTGDPNKKVVLFDYATGRGADVVQRLLSGFEGYLQTDDYISYRTFGEQNHITHLGCMAHARRKFKDAQIAAPKDKKQKHKITKADFAIQKFKKLYLIEKKIKDESPETRYDIRQQEAAPILNDLKQWADKAVANTLPKGKTGEAINYLLNNWSKLTEYINDGRLHIDNNPVENAIRPFAIGRKNWMFSDGQAGAKASAMMYSIIETAKANGLEPYHYLRSVFLKLPMATCVEDYEALLPWNIELVDLPKV